MESVSIAIKVANKPKIKRHDCLFRFIVDILPDYVKPNHLSALRIVLATPFFLLVIMHLYLPAGFLYIFASSLDALDGSMARIRNQETKFGAFLDAFADKVMNFAGFLGLLFNIDDQYYFYLVVPILGIDIILFQVALLKYLINDVLPTHNWLRQNIIIMKIGANNWGKAKMVTQVIILSCLLLFNPNTSFALHEKYPLLPQKFNLISLSLPFLVICVILGLLSLIGHLKVIKFNDSSPLQ